jgi:predicted RNase H-like HicB family nuclease
MKERCMMPKSTQEYLKEPYARILIPDEEGGYSAEILEFPGCFAEGETADEAMQALDRAAESWIQAAIDQGQEIPPPFMNQGYSGKIALRLPRSLHRKAAQFAEREGTSINQFLMAAIAARIGSEEFYEHLLAQLLKKLDDKLSIAVKGVTNIAVTNIQIVRSQLDTTATQSLKQRYPAGPLIRTTKTSKDIVSTFSEVVSNV